MIAAYQAADCIGEAIASVLAQTEPPLEIVVCDDGSTDQLAEALAPFHDKIQIIHKPHGGEASAKNAGAQAARGEFVSILDADDVYLPARLQALGRLLSDRPDLDIVTTDAYLEVDGRVIRNVYTPEWVFEVQDQRTAILQRNFVFGHVALRRELLLAAGGFDESIQRTTDWECWTRLILGGARVGAVMTPLSRYRVRESSLSADRELMLAGSVQTLRRALRHPQIRPPERRIAVQTIRRTERALARAKLSGALRDERLGLRFRALSIAFARHASVATRLKAAAAAVAPVAAARWVRQRDPGGWVGAGGTKVRRP